MFKTIMFGSVAFMLFVVTLTSFTTVDSGERAVVVRLGKVDRVLNNGFHWVNPFTEDVVTFETRVQKEEVEASAASKDLQSVSAKIAINYSLDGDRVSELYTALNKSYGVKVIDPSVQEAVKAATAKYTAEELITKREFVKDDIKRILVESVNTKAPGMIHVTDVSIVDFAFSKGFDQSIEEKVKAEQKALQAKNELERVKFEAEQKITQARAEAESIRLQSNAADNERYVDLKRLEIQLEFAKRWNGILPVNLYGSAPIPFLQLGQ